MLRFMHELLEMLHASAVASDSNTNAKTEIMNTNVTKTAAGRIIALVLNVAKSENKLADELRPFVGKIDPEIVGAELRAYWTSDEAAAATAGVNPVRPLLRAAALAGWSREACLKFGGDTAGNGHDGPARGLGIVTRQRVGQLVKSLFDEPSADSVEGEGEGAEDGGGSDAGNEEKQRARDHAKFRALAAKLTFTESEMQMVVELMQTDPIALAAKAAAEKEAAAAAKALEKEAARIAKEQAKAAAAAATARVQAHRARAKEKAEKEAAKKRAAAKKAVAAAFKASKKQAVKSLSGK
jgi:hypothetical protein